MRAQAHVFDVDSAGSPGAASSVGAASRAMHAAALSVWTPLRRFSLPPPSASMLLLPHCALAAPLAHAACLPPPPCPSLQHGVEPRHPGRRGGAAPPRPPLQRHARLPGKRGCAPAFVRCLTPRPRPRRTRARQSRGCMERDVERRRGMPAWQWRHTLPPCMPAASRGEPSLLHLHGLSATSPRPTPQASPA